LTEPKVTDAAVDSAKKRELLQAQLAAQVEKLEAQKLYVATGSLDKITAKEKESIDKRIGEQQRLVDAVRTAWQASLKEAESAAEKAAGLIDKARQKRASTADKVTNLNNKDLSPEDQAAANTQQAQDLFSQGSYAAAASSAARLDKRFKDAEQYQKQADEFLQRAEAFADKAGNAQLVEDIGKAQADALDAQARAKQAEADALGKQAEAQAALLNKLQADLKELQEAARKIEVKVEIAEAESKIKGLKEQIAAIPDKTVTVTVNTVNAGAAPTNDPAIAQAIADNGGFLPQFAFGGPLPGSAPHDRADNRLYWGTPGEWVIQRPAVRHYGAAFIAAVNAMKLPKFAFGGEIGASAIDRLSIPGLPSGAGASASKNLTLVLGGERYTVGASNDTIDRLTSFVSREALRKGGRR